MRACFETLEVPRVLALQKAELEESKEMLVAAAFKRANELQRELEDARSGTGKLQTALGAARAEAAKAKDATAELQTVLTTLRIELAEVEAA